MRGQAGKRLPRVARISVEVPLAEMVGPNPVELGLADNLARPGGNVTGLSFFAGPSMFAKRLELLKRAAPAVKRIAYLGRGPVGGQPI